MSFLALGVSSSFLFLCKVDSLFETPTSRRIAVAVALNLIFLFIQVYISCYRVKTPWYENNFAPPSNFLRGPIMRDQGNNI